MVKWEQMPVYETIDLKTKQEKKAYFIERVREEQAPSWSKVIQVNENDLYIIGGSNDLPSLVAHSYDVPRSTLRVNKKTQELKICSKLNQGRFAFGLCNIGNFIYVLGGLTSMDNSLDHCERYDVLEDKWTVLPKRVHLPKPKYGITLEAVKKQYIYCFGGHGEHSSVPYTDELFMRLDTHRMQKWE
jgi:hypothetical protein